MRTKSFSIALAGEWRKFTVTARWLRSRSRQNMSVSNPYVKKTPRASMEIAYAKNLTAKTVKIIKRDLLSTVTIALLLIKFIIILQKQLKNWSLKKFTHNGKNSRTKYIILLESSPRHTSNMSKSLTFTSKLQFRLINLFKNHLRIVTFLWKDLKMNFRKNTTLLKIS